MTGPGESFHQGNELFPEPAFLGSVFNRLDAVRKHSFSGGTQSQELRASEAWAVLLAAAEASPGPAATPMPDVVQVHAPVWQLPWRCWARAGCVCVIPCVFTTALRRGGFIFWMLEQLLRVPQGSVELGCRPGSAVSAHALPTVLRGEAPGEPGTFV